MSTLPNSVLAIDVSKEFLDTAGWPKSWQRRLPNDMPAPPSGRVYELWLQTTAGNMVPAGTMGKPGSRPVVLRGDATDATAVGITVEPEGGSDSPTSDPIALFDLEKAT